MNNIYGREREREIDGERERKKERFLIQSFISNKNVYIYIN